MGANFATKRRLPRTRILISGVFCNRFYADGDESEETDGIEGLGMVWIQSGRARRKDIHYDAVPHGHYVEGVATRGATGEVEMEGEKVTLPVGEPRTATTL